MADQLIEPFPYEEAPESWEPSWLVKNLIQTEALNIIAGHPKSHKSMLRRYLVACMVSKSPAFGLFEAGSPLTRALVLLSEDHPGAERGMIDGILREQGFPDEEPRPIDFAQPFTFDLKQATHIKRLIALVKKKGYNLVTYDPLVNFSTAVENSNEEMGMIGKHLHWVARETGAAALMVHHSPKIPGQSVLQQIRGGGSLAGAANVAMVVEKFEQGNRHRIRRIAKSAPDDEVLNLWLDVGGSWIWSVDDQLTQAKVLEVLREHPKSTTPELAKILGRRKGDVAKKLGEMEAQTVAVSQNGNRKEWDIVEV